MTSVPMAPEPVNGRLNYALGVVLQRALAKYPNEEARILRGHRIASMGGVELLPDGMARVLSQSFKDTWYAISCRSQCPCWDAKVAPRGRCKHQYGRALLEAALAYLQEPPSLDDLPEPYDFPQWTKYEATYQGTLPEWRNCNGIATVTEEGQFCFVPDGHTQGWMCSYADVALGPGVEQRPG